jgi:3-deoxy-manno-octulosonate cytidylyltransferase (CMP-KDO synthetase)
MIQRVVERVKLAGLARVVVATDDDRIAEHVADFAEVCLTSPHHATGTDRVAEVVAKLGLVGIVINIQGDEPLIDPAQIRDLADLLAFHDDLQIGTVVYPYLSAADYENRNKVKAFTALDAQNRLRALDFSRQASSPRLQPNTYMSYKHIGMYGFRAEVLPSLTALPQSANELAESLEQLRWLDAGYRIGAVITFKETTGVDIPEDIFVIENQIRS